MKLAGLHLLLTYQCNLECDHCFVWSGPRQSGTMTIEGIDRILRQAVELGTIEWIYFEGGEPFLHYAVLLHGVRAAAGAGFRTGIVSNGCWATEPRDAVERLRPLAGLVQDLSISGDRYHGGEEMARRVRNACAAARELDVPVGVIRIAPPEATDAASAVGMLPEGESAVMFRGRAAERLAPRVSGRPWTEFTSCPHEDLREPGRVHVDPFGHVHVCQGILLGNLFRTSLAEICSRDPDRHPVTGPLLAGGPAELARCTGAAPDGGFADACHLCYETRRAIRPRYRGVLGPDRMYGTCAAP